VPASAAGQVRLPGRTVPLGGAARAVLGGEGSCTSFSASHETVEAQRPPCDLVEEKSSAAADAHRRRRASRRQL
jgi:hypothetical protein